MTGKSVKAGPYLSIAAAARELGISRQVLQRQVKAGQVRSRGGKVRVSDARADRAAHVAPRPTADAGEDEATGELTGSVTTAEAKRHKEIELARLRRLDRQSREGELVLASVVHDTVFRCAREDRDALTNLDARSPEGKQTVIHAYDRLRPEMTRGVPFLAPVIEHIKELAAYSEAEVRAAVVSAMFTVFVETTADEDQAGSAVGEAGGPGLAENEVKLGTGAIVSLAPGEKASFADPARPNAQFDPFVQAFLRQIGVALELPFELLIKHFTASYSASRAALEMAWQSFRRRRTWLARRVCHVVYEWFIEEAVATGRLAAPGYFESPLVAQAYCGARWIGPGRPSIDQVKDAAADKENLALCVTTREEIRAERFGDRGEWEAVAKQLAKEEQHMRGAGLMPVAVPAPVQQGPGASRDDEPETEDEGDEETERERRTA